MSPEWEDWAQPDAQEYDTPRTGFGGLAAKIRSIGSRLESHQAGIKSETGLVRFLGNVAIEGDLTMPNGAIQSDWLATALLPAADSSTVTGFGLTTNTTDVIATTTLPIPDGYSKALLTAQGQIFALNPTANVDYLYARTRTTLPDTSFFTSMRPLGMMGPNNGSNVLSPSRAVMVDNLPSGGGAITFQFEAFTAFAAMSDAANLAAISGTAIFFR